jgi:dipeptidyl-peptidase-3
MSSKTTDANGPILERVGEFAIAPLEARGFDALPQRDRILAFYLSRAALAGRDIHYDQMGRDGLEIRDLLEEVLTHPRNLDPDFREALLRYLKQFWISSGNHNERTRAKFVPEFSYEDLRRGIAAARKDGAVIKLAVREPLEHKLERLRQALFDPSFEPLLTCKTAPSGVDLLACSSVNFYDGVTLADLAAFQEEHPLNSRLVKKDGRLEEQVWRAGRLAGPAGPAIPPGMYASQLRTVIGFLTKAKPFAPPDEAQALSLLSDSFASGAAADFKRYNLDWVKLSPAVDTVQGFIETYHDPRGRKGSWQGMVFFADPERTRLLQGLAAEARGFEERAPWDARFKRREFNPPVVAAVEILLAVGDGGPSPPIGVNLPNDDDIQEHVGNRSFLYANVLEAGNRATLQALTEEFALPDDRPLLMQHAVEAEMLLTAMHEALGHAAGRAREGLPQESSVMLGESYAALEEARAELVALHAIFDPVLLEKKLISSPLVAEAAYRDYLTHDLSLLRRVRTGDRLEDDHMRATHLIVEWLRAHGGGVAVESHDDRTYFKVADTAAMRKGVATLLAEVQRIKGEGDRAAARDLLERYATRIDPKLRDEVVERADRAKIPSWLAFVMPEIVPTRDASGDVVDAHLEKAGDFTLQMLRFSGKLPRETEGPR